MSMGKKAGVWSDADELRWWREQVQPRLSLSTGDPVRVGQDLGGKEITLDGPTHIKEVHIHVNTNQDARRIANKTRELLDEMSESSKKTAPSEVGFFERLGLGTASEFNALSDEERLAAVRKELAALGEDEGSAEREALASAHELGQKWKANRE